MVRKNIRERLAEKYRRKSNNTTICLAMIVKNESANMVRLLDSIKSIIDMISIDDTGSTDDTREVILKWGKDNNVPTTVHDEPFINFGYNRSHSVEMAKKTYPEAKYILLSDADFVWEIDKNFRKNLLTLEYYLVRNNTTSLSYWCIRLLSAKLDWECVGVTHEYWQA